MKKGFLILSRTRLDNMLVEAISRLKDQFAVTVIADEDSFSRYAAIKDIHIERSITIADAKKLRNTKPREDVLKKLSQIESELCISIYEANCNYLLYDIFVSRYSRVPTVHCDMKEYLPEIVYLEYELISNVVAQRNIKYIYYETIDLSLSYLLNAYAKKFDLQAYEFNFLPLPGGHRIRICTGLSRLSPRIEFAYKEMRYNRYDISRAKDVLSNIDNPTPTYYDNFHKRSKFKKILKRIASGPLGFDFRALLIRSIYKHNASRYFSKVLPDEPFVAYFLQHTPEASLCSRAPMFVNQEVFITQLAIYGPAEYKIVVKEHPKTIGNRPNSFYADLKTLPNVILLGPDFDSNEIINQSKCVVTITATALPLLSILKSKHLFTFTETFVNFFEHVIRVGSPQEFWKLLNNLENWCPIKRERIVSFLAACYHASYEFPEGIGNSAFPKVGGGSVLANALIDEISFE